MCEAREGGGDAVVLDGMLRVFNGFTGPDAPARPAGWVRELDAGAQEQATTACLGSASLGPGSTFQSGGHNRTVRGAVDQ